MRGLDSTEVGIGLPDQTLEVDCAFIAVADYYYLGKGLGDSLGKKSSQPLQMLHSSSSLIEAPRAGCLRSSEGRAR